MRFAVLIALALAGCGEPRAPATIFVPPTYRDGDRTVLPLTFPDGTRATIAYPHELAIAELGVRSYGSGTVGRRGRDFIVLRGAPTLRRALRLEFGRWTVEIQSQAMRARERRRWRKSLRVRETAEGFPVLEATAPLKLAAAGESHGPALEFGMSRRSPWLLLLLQTCGPKAETTMRGFSSWCRSDSVVAHAYGGRRFRAAASEGVELR